MRMVLLAMAMLATTTACSMTSDMAADAGAPPARSSATPADAASYVPAAGASDLYEIQSSQLALQKSGDANVRQFAQMMIAHHTQTTQQVTAAARSTGMNPPPPILMPTQADMIRQLEPLSGADFDRAYLSQQLRAHEMALALHRTYAERGDVAQLRTVADAAVPIVQQHLDRVRQMAR